MIAKNKRLIGFASVALIILLIPLITMQFTDEVNWGLADFVVASLILFGTVFMVEIIIRNVKKSNYRIILSLVVLLVLALTWLELAVGIFGSPLAGS